MIKYINIIITNLNKNATWVCLKYEALNMKEVRQRYFIKNKNKYFS